MFSTEAATKNCLNMYAQSFQIVLPLYVPVVSTFGEILSSSFFNLFSQKMYIFLPTMHFFEKFHNGKHLRKPVSLQALFSSQKCAF